MTTRTTNATVTFARPFTLAGVDGELPRGRYEIDTDEEQIESPTMVAWRRVSTTISVPRNGGMQVYPIDPTALDAALKRDAADD